MKPRGYVLIVDDFPDGREMVEEYLTFRGLTVQTASGGAEALRLARLQPPAIVLMDLAMPGIDGWEATRRFKADPRLLDTIVIALTAHALVDDRGRALAAGADAFVAKPFDLSALCDALISILDHGRASLNRLAASAPAD
jgi:CheY-like chemotaxis protein